MQRRWIGIVRPSRRRLTTAPQDEVLSFCHVRIWKDLILRSAAPSRRRLAAAPQGEEQRVSKDAWWSCSDAANARMPGPEL